MLLIVPAREKIARPANDQHLVTIMTRIFTMSDHLIWSF
jgi:hypothetical protein